MEEYLIPLWTDGELFRFKDCYKIDILLANIIQSCCHVLGRTSCIFKFVLIIWRHSLEFWVRWKMDGSFPSILTVLRKLPGPCSVRGEKVLFTAQPQCTQQFCAVIRQLVFAGRRMQRNIWNAETYSSPEAEILSFQLASGKAFYPGFTAGCKPSSRVP